MGGPPGSPTGSVRVEARQVWKRFGDFVALHDAHLALHAGRVRGLIGSNGSGKSTMVRILTGVYAADPPTTLEFDGAPVSGAFNTRRASQLGVRTVHQDSPLVDAMRVEEIAGLFYGFPARAGWVRWRSLRRRTQDLLDRVDAGLDARTTAGSLSPAERATVGLALALGASDHSNPVLILDEPTSPLSGEEARRFLSHVRTAAAGGAAVLLVTHRLGEVGEFCDDVTVFRGGEVSYEGAAAALTDQELVAHMVGSDHGARELTSAGEAPRRFAPTRRRTDRLLEVSELRGERLRGVSFDVAAGEVIGLTGTIEGDAAELGRLVAGAQKHTAGEIRIDGEPLPRHASPRLAMEAGLAYLPADRLKDSGIGALPVRENIALPAVGGYWGHRRQEDEDVRLVLESLDVRPPDPAKRLGSFSGGNQQKALLGKWLLRRPQVLVLDSPTIGIDPAAREQIFRLLRGLALVGTGVVLISNEAEHLARVCDRVFVLEEGVVKTEITGDNVTEEEIRFAGL